MSKETHNKGQMTRTLRFAACLGAAVLSCPAARAVDNPLREAQLAGTLNQTQSNMTDVIFTACVSGTNEAAFQARCDALVGFAQAGNRNQPLPVATWQPSVRNVLQRVAPEQMLGQGTTATRTSANILSARLQALRLGTRGLSLSGSNFNGQPLMGNSFADLSSAVETGGAAGDDIGASLGGRLGAFINGIYNFGSVDSTFNSAGTQRGNQLGFDFDSGGVTAGMDYRFTSNLVLGAAFTYLHMATTFDRSGGDLDSDSYSGSLYGTFYPSKSFYVDGLFSVGGIDYSSNRQINYVIPGADVVNTQAQATSGAMQYSVSVGGGYNYAWKGLTLNPYARFNYINLDIGGFSERGGDGWAMRFGDQTVESLTTTLGTQLTYAISTPWGVLTPNVRGEWRHEFEDDKRIIPVRFLGDTTSGLTFSTVTENPDRNYFIVGTGVSATFAHGVSAFFNYDALLGYRDIESHSFMVGARMEF